MLTKKMIISSIENIKEISLIKLIETKYCFYLYVKKNGLAYSGQGSKGIPICKSIDNQEYLTESIKCLLDLDFDVKKMNY